MQDIRILDRMLNSLNVLILLKKEVKTYFIHPMINGTQWR